MITCLVDLAAVWLTFTLLLWFSMTLNCRQRIRTVMCVLSLCKGNWALTCSYGHWMLLVVLWKVLVWWKECNLRNSSCTLCGKNRSWEKWSSFEFFKTSHFGSRGWRTYFNWNFNWNVHCVCVRWSHKIPFVFFSTHSFKLFQILFESKWCSRHWWKPCVVGLLSRLESTDFGKALYLSEACSLFQQLHSHCCCCAISSLFDWRNDGTWQLFCPLQHLTNHVSKLKCWSTYFFFGFEHCKHNFFLICDIEKQESLVNFHCFFACICAVQELWFCSLLVFWAQAVSTKVFITVKNHICLLIWLGHCTRLQLRKSPNFCPPDVCSLPKHARSFVLKESMWNCPNLLIHANKERKTWLCVSKRGGQQESQKRKESEYLATIVTVTECANLNSEKCHDEWRHAKTKRL